jgi:poly-gamma-glutamate system protein
MRETFRPRFGRWSTVSPGVLAAAGWVIALAAVGAGTAGVLPPMALRRAPPAPSAALAARAHQAETAMRRAEAFLATERARLGVLPDEEARPDPSGLIGGEVTPLMTTLGSLEAKRIATNPAWARELTLRLAGAGIGSGDVLAASLSGSFPGLNLALAAACQALGAELVAISSVTASTWGANQPGFTWPEIEARLVDAGLVGRVSIAVTAGGEGDVASDLEGEDRKLALAIRDAAARRLGVPALAPAGFDEAVRARLAAYRRVANGRRISLYVNVGGANASLGRSAAILKLRSGFLPPAPVGARHDQGVASLLAAEGVPILMLLNVRDLALRWGIPLSGASAR